MLLGVLLGRQHFNELGALVKQLAQLRVQDRMAHQQQPALRGAESSGASNVMLGAGRAWSAGSPLAWLTAARIHSSSGMPVRPAGVENRRHFRPKSSRSPAPGSTSTPSTRSVGEPKNRSATAASDVSTRRS